MASKKTLEVVSTAPVLRDEDLEALLAPRLADELLQNIDMGKLAQLAISHLGKKFQNRLIDWLITGQNSTVALNEIDAVAIASNSEDEAA